MDTIWHSVSDPRAEIHAAQAARQQAADAQHIAETQLRMEQEQHQETRDDRDSWASLAHDLLKEKVLHTAEEEGIEPHRLDADALEGISDSLADDWAHGTKAPDLSVAAKLADWETQ